MRHPRLGDRAENVGGTTGIGPGQRRIGPVRVHCPSEMDHYVRAGEDALRDSVAKLGKL